ncbi:MAG: aminoacyl-tRNA hydrolase [Clostridia bacterium]|jgi:PTH1 family peptidyl-tRNA hydrolase
MENMFIIAGLGNPGLKYRNTRHNMGFCTVDILAERFNIKVSKLKFKALYGEGSIEGAKVILVKPQTFMNLSGESIREIVEWYKIPIENLIVIYDDVDIPIGTIRVRAKGSAGTHNGMKSVIYQVQSDSFPRIRVGVGRPKEGWDLADFVLGKFNEDEIKIIYDALVSAADAAVEIIKKECK